METKNITKNPKAVEEIFCIPFSKLPQQQMDIETGQMYFDLSMGSLAKRYVQMDEAKKPFQLKILESSLEHRFTFTIADPNLRLFILYIAQSAGGVIMYLAYLQYECKKNNVKNLDWQMFSRIFAMGFPSEEDLHKLWDSQKVPFDERGSSDNLLDYQSAMESIQFT